MSKACRSLNMSRAYESAALEDLLSRGPNTPRGMSYSIVEARDELPDK